MQSLLLSALVASGTILSTASAQYYPPVDANATDINVRNQWCISQTASCKLLCQNQELKVTANECFPENLYFQCTCSNGLSPNVTEYSQTIPYFICTQEVIGCVEACSGDSACGAACTANKQCGATDPTRVNATTTTTRSGQTSTSSTPGTFTDANGFEVTGGPDSSSDSDSGSDSDSPSDATRLFVEVGSAYGMGIIVAGIAAGMAMVGI